MRHRQRVAGVSGRHSLRGKPWYEQQLSDVDQIRVGDRAASDAHDGRTVVVTPDARPLLATAQRFGGNPPQAVTAFHDVSIADALTKDPAQLAALVEQHNAAVEERNQQHDQEAVQLAGQRHEANTALSRLVQAIESGA